MPELPDITVYVEAIAARTLGVRLERVRLGNPFVLRSVAPPLEAVAGRAVSGVSRLGKQIVISVDGDLHVVVHLMVLGRLHWKPAGVKLPGKAGLAALDFASGTLLLTESGSKRRAALRVVAGADGLAAFDRGGLEVLTAELPSFLSRLRAERHTLKRALTDPRLFSGIGNAYSDEILHAARLSPMQLSTNLDDAEAGRLHAAVRSVLEIWTDTLRTAAGNAFPEHVTAFREGMAVHGRYGKPCPVCGAPVQRLVYAENEANYCASCQTGGRLLADRALSRLLRDDWPRSLEELEEHLAARRQG
jgi:formamidopyrimidine-DNA glycosylase